MSKKRKKAGLSPGSVIFTGRKKVDTVLIHHIQYDEHTIHEKNLDNKHDTVFKDVPKLVDWFDVRGLHDTHLLEQMGKMFDVHPLALEDVADTSQRPKFEEYGTGNFFILRSLEFNKASLKVEAEQVALYFKEDLVLSFQENDSDLFKEVRSRLQIINGRIRLRGADYLVYALIDLIVDRYNAVLDEIEQAIIDLEDQISTRADQKVKNNIHSLKKELLDFRRSILPLREAIGAFAKSDSSIVRESTAVFLRDVQDHATQVLDTADSYRDSLNGLQDLLNSEVGFKMNQTIHLLTLISTIFIPLTFLAGIYGMNFDNMPELHHPQGYFYLLIAMGVIAIGLLVYFKRKKWIG